MGRETSCVRFVFLLGLDGSSQVHKCFELLYIRDLMGTNGANVVVAEGLSSKRGDVTTQNRRVYWVSVCLLF